MSKTLSTPVRSRSESKYHSNKDDKNKHSNSKEKNKKKKGVTILQETETLTLMVEPKEKANKKYTRGYAKRPDCYGCKNKRRTDKELYDQAIDQIIDYAENDRKQKLAMQKKLE